MIRCCCAVFVASLAGAWLLIFFTMVLMGSLAFFVESALGIFELWLGVHAILLGLPGPAGGCCPAGLRRAADVLPVPLHAGLPGRDRWWGCCRAAAGAAGAGRAVGVRALFAVLALRVLARRGCAGSRRSGADVRGDLRLVTRCCCACSWHVGPDGLQYRADFIVRGVHRDALDGRRRWCRCASCSGRAPACRGGRLDVLPESLVVVGFFTLLHAVLEGAVSPSLTAVVEHIRHGTLDFVLLKPADAQFLVSTAKLRAVARGRRAGRARSSSRWRSRSWAGWPGACRGGAGGLALLVLADRDPLFDLDPGDQRGVLGREGRQPVATCSARCSTPPAGPSRSSGGPCGSCSRSSSPSPC